MPLTAAPAVSSGAPSQSRGPPAAAASSQGDSGVSISLSSHSYQQGPPGAPKGTTSTITSEGTRGPPGAPEGTTTTINEGTWGPPGAPEVNPITSEGTASRYEGGWGPPGAPPGSPGAPLNEEEEEEGVCGGLTLASLPQRSEALTTLMRSAAVRRAVSLKSLLIENEKSFSVDRVQFDVLGKEQIAKLAEREIVNRELYVHLTNTPHPFGVLDLHLGKNIYNIYNIYILM